jgi:hypothetical protein
MALFDRASQRVEIRTERAPVEEPENGNQDHPSESQRNCDVVGDAHPMFNGGQREGKLRRAEPGERTRLNRRTWGAEISSTRNSCVIPDGAVVRTIEPTPSGGGERRSARATLRSHRGAFLSFDRNAQARSRSLFTTTDDVMCICDRDYGSSKARGPANAGHYDCGHYDCKAAGAGSVRSLTML